MRLRVTSFALLLALAVVLSAQIQQRTYDLRHVSFWLSFDEGSRSIDAKVVNNISVLKDGTTVVAFGAQGLEFSEVKVNGRSAPYFVEGSHVFVTIGEGRKAGEFVDVEMLYKATPTGGLYFVNKRDAWPAKSSMVYTKGQPEYNKQWLATYGSPDDKATSECWISCAPGNTVVSNGLLVGVDRSDKAWTYHWKMDQPHPTYLIAFASGDFEKSTEKHGDKPVEYYFPRGLESQAAASFAGTARMIGEFSRLLGFEYPFDRFSQLVVGDFVTGGMENTTMVINNISTLHEPYEKPLAESTGLVAHELAHQWFGDYVTCSDWSHLWINEGFASFLPAFWTRFSEGADEYELDRKATMGGGIAQSTSDKAPVVSSDFGSNIERIYRNAVYGGAAARLFMLMDHHGEERFWRGVRKFLNDKQYSAVTTDDFFKSMSDSSGEDLTWFKDQWFLKGGLPTLNVVNYGDDTVTVTDTKELNISVPFWGFSNGKWSLAKNGAAARFHVAKPFLVDPERRFLIYVTGAPAFPADQALSGWRAAPNAGIKDALLPLLSARDAVLLLSEEKIPTLRSRLVSKLGNDETATLIGLLDDRDRRVANIAVNRLGACEASPPSCKR